METEVFTRHCFKMLIYDFKKSRKQSQFILEV